MFYIYFASLVLVLQPHFLVVFASGATCVDKCCSEIKNKHVKMKCVKIQRIDQSTFSSVNNSTYISQLDLSNNTIRELHIQAIPFRTLMRLNLERNIIEEIEDAAFRNLNNLKKLILSSNRLKLLRKDMFIGLNSLDTLKVNLNQLTFIKNDTFEHLLSLKQLDIAGNPLICGCEILWLIHADFKLSASPRCLLSNSLSSQLIPLADMGLEDKCEGNDDIKYYLKLIPEHDQVTFEGDSLQLVCQILHYELTHPFLSWQLDGRDPFLLYDDTIQISSNDLDEIDTVASTLVISELHERHSGKWACNMITPENNQTRSIYINVISKVTVFCPITRTRTDKGYYEWPETISGRTVEQHCNAYDNMSSESSSYSTASHYCASNGSWLNLNVDDCPFFSPTTRILLQFSKMNLTNDTNSLYESAIRLHNFTTTNLKTMNHVNDIHFLMTTIENYIEYLDSEPKIAWYLLRILNSVIQLPKNLLEKAQQQHDISGRFMNDIHSITNYSPLMDFRSLAKFLCAQEQFAIREIPVTSSDSMYGLTCSSISGADDSLYFDFSPITKIIPAGYSFESSVQISANLLRFLETNSIRIFVLTFKDGRLFNNGSFSNESNLVIGVNIINAKIPKLSDPLNITLKNNLHLPSPPVLMWWNSVAGLWTKDGCSLASSLRAPFLKFTCDRFGYFSLLVKQNLDVQLEEKNVQKRFMFKLFHPSVYAGTFICITCLLLAVGTYCCCYSRIQMSRIMKHSLPNTWLSASLLLIIFSVEIHQTESETLCQLIGLNIHYFSLSTLFWMSVTIKALYKMVPKSNSSVSTPSEDIPVDIPIEKPMLGVYLIGWGISAILCGISGAVNIRGYANMDFCFLSPGPALGTILIPGGLILLYIFVMCLLVKCAIASADSNPQLSVGTQAIDLDLLDGGGMVIGGRSSYLTDGCNSVRSINTPSSQLEDTEHSPTRQLKAFAIFLTLYMAAICFGFSCVMAPLQYPEYEDKLFSIMYSIACVFLGPFVLFFYCFARNDVRAAWGILMSGDKFHNKPNHSHIVMNGFATATQPHINNTTPILGRVRGNVIDNTVKPTADVHSTKDEFLKQVPNINLVHLHRQHYRDCSTLTADGIFYNPQQTIVARKFFKKQRKKRAAGALQVRRCRSGGSSPVSNGFIFIDRGPKKIAASQKKSIMVNTEFEDCQKNVYTLRSQNCGSRYDEMSSEKHPLTYDEPDITTGEENKTGTESEATFTLPEYAEIPEPNLNKYNDRIAMGGCVRDAAAVRCHQDKWCNCDTISDVNSEPTYNYAYIRDGYPSSRSVLSDNSRSSGPSPLYIPVAQNSVRSIDGFKYSPQTKEQHYGLRFSRNRDASAYYHPTTNHQREYQSHSRKRHQEEGYRQLQKETYVELSPSSDLSSEDKVETCV